MIVFTFPFLCLQGVLYREYQECKTVWEEEKTRLVREKEEALLVHQQDLIKQKQFKVQNVCAQCEAKITCVYYAHCWEA